MRRRVMDFLRGVALSGGLAVGIAAWWLGAWWGGGEPPTTWGMIAMAALWWLVVTPHPLTVRHEKRPAVVTGQGDYRRLWPKREDA